MMKLIESKTTAWIALILTVVLIVLAALSHTPWWGYIAIFFAFMAAFSHIAALYLRKMNRATSSMLERCAFIFCCLAVIGLIAEYIISNLQL